MTSTIANGFLRLVIRSKRLSNAFKDVGLVTMLGNVSRDMALNLRKLVAAYGAGTSAFGTLDRPGIAVSAVCEVSSGEGSRGKPCLQIPSVILSNFDAMMNLAAKLLEGNMDSCAIWEKSARG